MNSRMLLTACGALAFAVTSHAVETAVDDVEIVADTNIVVVAGDTLRIEYLHGSGGPYVLTKSGDGILELATVDSDGLRVDLVGGTLASRRPSVPSATAAALHLDASRTDRMTCTEVGGRKEITTWYDVNTDERKASTWGGGYGRPKVVENALNGLSVADFGPFSDKNHAASGSAMTAFSPTVPTKEFFCVWEDDPAAKSLPLVDGKEFYGPTLFGHTYQWRRGKGGEGNSFRLYDSDNMGALKANVRLDHASIIWNSRPGDGYHILHNTPSSSVEPATMGWNAADSLAAQGGFRVAEILFFSDYLPETDGTRVEAYLQSKWFGATIASVRVRAGATLDVSVVKFNVDDFTADDGAHLVGMENLAYRTGLVANYASSSGALEKTGPGALSVLGLDAGVTSISVASGTLSVSPLLNRDAEYHLDATRTDTMTTHAANGTNYVSNWTDTEKSDHRVKTSSRSPTGHEPYLDAKSGNGLDMVNFGSFRDPNHTDGWGGMLDASPYYTVGNDSIHDIFVVWKDDPSVKDLPYAVTDKPFSGPCLFGWQDCWFRGWGGAGQSFPLFFPYVPSAMVGDVHVDGVAISAVDVKNNFRPADGLHVASIRVTGNGAPFIMIGGNSQVEVTMPDGSTQKGIYGGLSIGEAFLFKAAVSDVVRANIEKTLLAKWCNGANSASYDAANVRAGASLAHPHADLVVGSMTLGGTLSVRNVTPAELIPVGLSAVVDGTLTLPADGVLTLDYDAQEGTFPLVTATSAVITGKGQVEVRGVPDPAALLGRSFKVVAAENILGTAVWRSPRLVQGGVYARLSAKADGLYLEFRDGGLTLSIK